MAGKKEKQNGNGKKAETSAVARMGYPGIDMMRDEMERMMHRLAAGDWTGGMGHLPMLRDWMNLGAQAPFAGMLNVPKAEMSEGDGQYELSVELPGLDEKDIELTLTDRTLVLKGEKKAEKESKDKDFHFSERSYGSFRRQFVLPDNVDRDAMKAEFARGVLQITLPKTKEAKAASRRIEVSGG